MLLAMLENRTSSRQALTLTCLALIRSLFTLIGFANLAHQSNFGLLFWKVWFGMVYLVCMFGLEGLVWQVAFGRFGLIW